MPGAYDAIVIGAGHNGLTAAAYLARAGRKVLVLERRHLVGGAAVTEEVFPGFKFSVCSYVVSLLRPEIIRDLQLARHGLDILPLDGTFTPMLSGDYLWRMNDHARTFREISRHSRADAEVYDEYGRAMVEMGRTRSHSSCHRSARSAVCCGDFASCRSSIGTINCNCSR
jgi:phytoene dehydrogenase-like protein